MEPLEDNDPPEGIEDDPVLQLAFVAELERVVGAEDMSSESRPFQFQWILPVTGLDEILAILRKAPSGLGVSGLEALLRAEFGTRSGLKAIEEDSDERDV